MTNAGFVQSHQAPPLPPLHWGQQLQELANANLSSTPIQWSSSGAVLPSSALARQNVLAERANALAAPFTPPLSIVQGDRDDTLASTPADNSASARTGLPQHVTSTLALQSGLNPIRLQPEHPAPASVASFQQFGERRVTDVFARTDPRFLSMNENVNFGLNLSSANSSRDFPLSDPPPPAPAHVQVPSMPTLANVVRARLATSLRQQGPPPLQQHQGSGSGGGRASSLTSAPGAAGLSQDQARESVAGSQSNQSNASRQPRQGETQHFDPGVAAIVDQALNFEVVAQQQFLEFSSHLNEEASFAAVRDSAIIDLSSITGLSHEQIDSQISMQNGDVAAAYVSSFCAAAQLADEEFPANAMRAGMSELSRRRRRQENLNHSRAAAHILSEQGPSAAYSSLSNRVNLPAQLGYHYRADNSGIHLPPFPGRFVSPRIRHRSNDDLEDLVVSDHDSDPALSPNPARRSRPIEQSGGNGGGGGGHHDSGDDSDPSRSSSNSDSGSDRDVAGSDDIGSSGSSCDSSEGCGEHRDQPPRRNDPAAGNARDRNPPPSDARYGELSPDRLERLLERLLSRQSGGNNGLMAPKPNFWTLGSPPNGGYHLETFSRLYREFQEFKRIYGKHTGVSFKNLITLDVSPLVRHDLKLRRSEWKQLDDRSLIRMLKSRLGYQDSDHYIALLESCPKLPDKMKDTVALSNHFKDLSGKMLEIIERAHKHKVKLRRESLKHVFTTAIKSSYRMTNWFHLEKFKSIGDSVRFLNTKIKDRLSHELERKHEQEQDARVAGVRGQIGAGTQESSDAPDRRPPNKKSNHPVKGGIVKAKPNDSKGKSQSPFSKLSPEDYRKKMDELYQVENKLPRGRHFHERTVFCGEDPCPYRRCQGCGDHTVKGKSGHDRPHCPHRKHKDFVAEGYFHERWPGRTSIFANDSRPSPTAAPSQNQRSNLAARFNNVGNDPSRDNEQ